MKATFVANFIANLPPLRPVPDARQLHGVAGMRKGVKAPKVAKAPKAVVPKAAPSAPPAPAPAPPPAPSPAPAGPATVAATPPAPAALDPKMTGTEAQAVDYIQKQAQQLFGRQLNPQEMQQASQIAQQAGYDGKGVVTGAHVNAVVAAMQKVASANGQQHAELVGTTHVPNAPQHAPGRVSLAPNAVRTQIRQAKASKKLARVISRMANKAQAQQNSPPRNKNAPPTVVSPGTEPRGQSGQWTAAADKSALKGTPAPEPGGIKKPDTGKPIAPVAKALPTVPPKALGGPAEATNGGALLQVEMDWMPEGQYQKMQKGLKKAVSARKKSDKAQAAVPPAAPIASLPWKKAAFGGPGSGPHPGEGKTGRPKAEQPKGAKGEKKAEGKSGKSGGGGILQSLKRVVGDTIGERWAEVPKVVDNRKKHALNPSHISAPKGSAPAPGKSIGPIRVAPSATAQGGAAGAAGGGAAMRALGGPGSGRHPSEGHAHTPTGTGAHEHVKGPNVKMGKPDPSKKAYTVIDSTGKEVSHHDDFKSAYQAGNQAEVRTGGQATVRNNQGKQSTDEKRYINYGHKSFDPNWTNKALNPPKTAPNPYGYTQPSPPASNRVD